MVCSLVIFRYPSIWHTIKTNYKPLDYWSRNMLNFNFSEKGLGLVSPPHFAYDSSRKWFSCYILLTDQISLIAFTSRDIGQYVYYNYLLSRLWNWPFFNKPFFYMNKNSRQKPRCPENEKNFWGEIKTVFHHF